MSPGSVKREPDDSFHGIKGKDLDREMTSRLSSFLRPESMKELWGKLIPCSPLWAWVTKKEGVKVGSMRDSDADGVAKRSLGEPLGLALIVSTEHGFLEYYRKILSRLSFIPLARTGYEEALACLHLVRFDVIVVDQGSIAFEGAHFLKRASLSVVHTAILVAARRFDERCLREAKDLGAAEYLEDPIPVSIMAQIITGLEGAP